MNSIISRIIITIALLSLALVPSAPAQQPQPKQTPPEGGQPKAFSLPKKETFALPNGLQVTMVPYGSIPKVAIAAYVNAGEIDESAEQVWLAELVGDLMKEGTTLRSAEQVAQDVARMGGSLDINAGMDQTTVSTDVLSEFGPAAVKLIAEVLQKPLLPASELARLKKDYLRRLTVDRSRPGPLAYERFRHLLYPDHPYGRIYPTEQMIGGYTIEEAQKFYHDNFGAARTHLYVVGQFNPGQMRRAISQGFGGWASGSAPVEDIPKPVAQRTLSLIDRPGSAQSTIWLGLPIINPSNPDYIALQVTDSLLGGSFASRITSNIREQKGYTYSPRSQVSTRYRDAYWVEIADVTTAVTGPSLKEIFYEIDRLRKEPPTEAELQGIKNYLAGIFVIRNSSRQGIIGQLAFIDLHKLPETFLTRYVQNVFAVTAQDVQRIAQTYLTPDKMTIVVVGDKSKVAPQLAPFGEIANN